MRLEPWQVWWVDFDPQVGSEQAGHRPAIVVGSSLILQMNRKLGQVVPCTTTNRGLPIHPQVLLAGKPGYAMCEQVKSISINRFDKPHRAGKLKPAEIERVKFALRQVLDVE